MAESPILRKAQISLGKFGAVLFRQNTGLGWVGKLISKTAGRVTLDNARPLHAGLCKGSSDGIGWTPVVITPEMVGLKLAVFTAIEIKAGDTATTKEQKDFLAAVSFAGGMAMILREGDDASQLARFPIAAVQRQLPGQSARDF
jgi:hypothetical protein